MGKMQKSSKQRYFRYIRPAQETQQQQQQLQQQQQQQPPPQNDLLIRSLNVAAELFTAGAEAVALQGEAEEQLQEQQLRHQQEQDRLNRKSCVLQGKFSLLKRNSPSCNKIMIGPKEGILCGIIDGSLR